MLKREKFLLEISAACDFYEPLARADFAECSRRLRAAREIAANFHASGGRADVACAALSKIADRLLEDIFRVFLSRRPGRAAQVGAKFCVAALGGYGRREMCPRSDIDIMFLFSRSLSGQLRSAVVDEFLYPLWNLHLKVGHVSLTSAEAVENASKDAVFKNALLDARVVVGSKPLFGRFKSRFSLSVFLGRRRFFGQLMRLKRRRHEKFGWTPYLQEPDVKNGVGGLRDFQIMRTIARVYSGGDLRSLVRGGALSAAQYMRLARAFEFLLGARIRLHCAASAPTETVDAEFQEPLAEFFEPRLQPASARVPAFMRRLYFAFRTIDFAAKTLRRRMRLKLPDDMRGGFRSVPEPVSSDKKTRVGDFFVWRGEIRARSASVFARSPEKLLDAFLAAQKFGARLSEPLEIAVGDSLRFVDEKARNSPAAASKILSILKSGGRVARTLEAMHYWGVLGAFLPEFGEITCMVQQEYYHRYTADMHTINAIANLDKIFCARRGGGDFWRYHKTLVSLASPELLYLTLLFHDIGKGDGVNSHARAGAEIARRVLERWNLPRSDVEAVVFAVENHLEMSRFWQRNDVDDADAAARFAKIVGNETNLKNLYILTFCDASATNESFWNSYKQSLHESLYANTLRFFAESEGGGARKVSGVEMIVGEIIASRELEGMENLLIEHVQNLPESQLSGCGRADIVRHVRLVAEFARGESAGSREPAADWSWHPMRSMTSLCVVSRDRSGLFLNLVGVLSLMGFDILGSKILTRADGITVDTFFLADAGGGLSSSPHLLGQFKSLFARANAGKLALDAEVGKIFQKSSQKAAGGAIKSARVFRRANRIVLEVDAYDCRGVLYEIAKMIRRRGYDILFARVNTEHNYGRNTFYIKKSPLSPEHKGRGEDFV